MYNVPNVHVPGLTSVTWSRSVTVTNHNNKFHNLYTLKLMKLMKPWKPIWNYGIKDWLIAFKLSKKISITFHCVYKRMLCINDCVTKATAASDARTEDELVVSNVRTFAAERPVFKIHWAHFLFCSPTGKTFCFN